ncbi:MAG: helix-turn-helix transcriptional regulator [Rivularia sp. (in: Bacteria)]|nr:helix-turn-helix transcriptional regulator [Rivularia sp. MS3]
MSKDEPPLHLHLLESFDAQWDGLNLIYEIEPPNEMPEIDFGQHFIIIARGNFRASYMLNGSWHHIDYTKGDIAIIPANQGFPKTQVDREVPLLELFIDPALMTRNSCELGNVENIELEPQLNIRDPLIENIGLALKTELELNGAESKFYAESMATALSIHLLSRYSSHQPQIKKYSGGLSDYKLKEVTDYIQENLDKKLTQAELSSIVCMSPHYFATLFKQSMGITPYEYVMKSRIEKAKQLLLKRDLTIVEICSEVGFQNQSHFTRVFRQYTKTTPKRFRDEGIS